MRFKVVFLEVMAVFTLETDHSSQRGYPLNNSRKTNNLS